MVAFLRGAREVGRPLPRQRADRRGGRGDHAPGSLIVNLQKWHKEYYKGDKIAHPGHREAQRHASRRRTSARRAWAFRRRSTSRTFRPSAWRRWTSPPRRRTGHRRCQATGQAALDTETTNAAQAKLMAYRAAELDARRKLAEELDGLMITSSTSVKDFVAMDDQIRTSMLTFQQGGRRVPGTETAEAGRHGGGRRGDRASAAVEHGPVLPAEACGQSQVSQTGDLPMKRITVMMVALAVLPLLAVGCTKKLQLTIVNHSDTARTIQVTTARGDDDPGPGRSRRRQAHQHGEASRPRTFRPSCSSRPGPGRAPRSW